MPKISSTTELLMLSSLGLATTVYESSIQDINTSVKEVWAMQFPPNATIGMESLLKTVMTAITLARGLTVHVYIAAYLLMFYPLLFERGVTLLLVWMFICALRSVIINFVAMLTGCVLCSMYPDLKPVCFEFVAAKAIEISCSVFMWLSVNDHHIRLRNQRRSSVAKRMIPKTTQITDSDLSLVSSDITLASFMDFEDDIAASSEDSIMVKAAVDWLMRMAFGIKLEHKKMEIDDVRAQRFLNMSAEELMELQNRIREKLITNKDEDQLVKKGPPDLGKTGSSLISSSALWHVDDMAPKAVTEPSYASLNNPQGSTQIPVSEERRTSKTKRSGQQIRPTQSTGSQTKDPSRKLRERLSNDNSRKDDPEDAIGRQLTEELMAHKEGLLKRMGSSNKKSDRPYVDPRIASTSKGKAPGGSQESIHSKNEEPRESVIGFASVDRAQSKGILRPPGEKRQRENKVSLRKKPGYE